MASERRTAQATPTLDATTLLQNAEKAIAKRASKHAAKKQRQRTQKPEQWREKRNRQQRASRSRRTPEQRTIDNAKKWQVLQRRMLRDPAVRMRVNKRNTASAKRTRERRRESPPEFVAIDGEGVTRRPSHQHDYVLLGCSDGRTLERWDNNGLPTRECLDFLLETKRKHPKAVIVGFSTGYDVNMMLRDIPRTQLEYLQLGDEANWTGYRLRYFPGKSFYVARIVNYEIVESVTIWDVWGFFQASFVAALSEWKIAPDDVIGLIERMKSARGIFKVSERESIKEYCISECRLLTDIMEEVSRTLIDVNLYLTRWDGAGAVAGALLAKHDIKRYTTAVNDIHMRDILLRAYFGGRVETYGVGLIDSECYAYDINSAYPAQAYTLPNCVGTWEYVVQPTILAPYAIYHVRWTLPDSAPAWNQIAPFPFRAKGGLIFWPSAGEGWYHAVEVEAAIDSLPQYTYNIIEGWIFTPADDVKPFAWVPALYDDRLAYKQAGDARHIILKLGLNAMYGKLAQTVGMYGKAPPYQSFFWAGMITAGTRATMLRAMVTTDQKNLIGASTDGIFTRAPLNVPISKKLGEWECKDIERGLLVCQPGVMMSPTLGTHKTAMRKSRGFAKEGLNYNAFCDAWLTHDIAAKVPVHETRFHGLGRALMENMVGWRRWIESTHTIGFTTAPKKMFDIHQHKHFKPAKYPHLYQAKAGPVQAVQWRLLFCIDREPGDISAPYSKNTVYDTDRRRGEQHEHEQPDEATSMWP